MMDHLTELLNELSLQPNKRDILTQIKTMLSSMPPTALDIAVKCISIEPFFNCFVTSNRDEIELLGDILNILRSSVSIDFLISKFGKQLKDGLLHPSSDIKQLVLLQIVNCAANPQEYVKFLSDLDVLTGIISLHISNELSVVKYAQKILMKLADFEEGLDLMFTPQSLQSFHEVMAENDTIKYRILEVVIYISKQSLHSLERCVTKGLLTKLLLDIDSHDILIQLNGIELLADLAMKPHGLKYLENDGVVRKLEFMLDRTNSDIQAKFLLPGLFKFFGYVGHLHPHEICNRYRNFISRLYDAVDSNENTPGLVLVAIQTIAVIGSTASGKVALNNIGNPTIEVVKCLGRTIQNSPMDIKIAALNGLANLMNCEDRNPAIEEIVKKWFDSLTENPMKLLMDICKHPFVEVRCAVLSVYKALADQSWSQRYMNDYPGFIEYLLDRSTESDKDGKLCKYEVIQVLANSSTTAAEFGNIVVLRLRQYVNEGPYFVQVESAVTFEGDN